MRIKFQHAVRRGSAARRLRSITICDQSTACNPYWHILHRESTIEVVHQVTPDLKSSSLLRCVSAAKHHTAEQYTKTNFSANLRVVSLKLLELTQFAWPNLSIYFNFLSAVPRDDVIESTRFLMRPPVIFPPWWLLYYSTSMAIL